MNNGRVSVIICTRDRPDALRRCLDSLTESKAPPIEIVVVDQSSGKAAEGVVSRASKTSPFPLRYFHLDSVGHTKARNAGVEASRGDIVAFTDDDCIVDSNWIEVVGRELADPRVNCLCGQTRPANHKNRPKPALISTLAVKRTKLLKGKHIPVNVGKGNNMAFRKVDLLALGGFNEQIGMGTCLHAGDDADLFYRLLEAGGTVLLTSDAVVYHVQPADWQAVFNKKRSYSLAFAAILAARVRYGDPYAGLLLAGKILYEFGYLLCGGALRMNRNLMLVGWHSLLGTFSGLAHVRNRSFCEEIRRLSLFAREFDGRRGRDRSQPADIAADASSDPDRMMKSRDSGL